MASGYSLDYPINGIFMKIEMAEHLVRTWLKHVKGCQIVELNWKPSPEWDMYTDPILEDIFAVAKERYPESIKETVNLSQFIKQAEIDVVGFKIGEQGVINRVYATDSAFHSNGLSYGGNEETKSRIFKKMLRTMIVMRSYFPQISTEVSFVSPFIQPGRLLCIREAMADVTSLAEGEGAPDFKLFGPEEFGEEVLEPVLSLSDNISDTSELFLRAWQLVEPFLGQSNSNVVDDQTCYKTAVNRPNTSQSGRLSSRASYDKSDRHYAHITALYLSRFDHSDLNLGNQGETLKELSRNLGIRFNTLKNYRDAFDSYTESRRQGWKKPLSDQQKAILVKYKNHTKAELKALVQSFLE